MKQLIARSVSGCCSECTYYELSGFIINQNISKWSGILSEAIEDFWSEISRSWSRNRENMMERENANIKNELRATQLHVDRLRRRLEEREIEIDKLKSTVRIQNRVYNDINALICYNLRYIIEF